MSSAALACFVSQATLGDVTVEKNQSDYESLRTINWSETAWLMPECIVRPSKTDEVSTLMEIVQLTKTSFAVRSGGHEVEPGFANTNGGLLIDMALFNEVLYDAAASSVTVGTGNRWINVYESLDPLNVTVVGGRVSDPGVGGLTLGGGLSYLSNKHGMVCDNVLNYEVVLADGSVVNASASSNQDLFWALKGGLNNFGIVLRLTLRTYPMGNIWGGLLSYSLDQAPVVLEAFAEWEKSGENDTNSNLIIQVGVTNATIGTLVTLFYAQPVERPKAFDPFFRIPMLSDTTAIQNMSSFLNSAPINAITVPRWNWRTTSFRSNASFYQTAIEIANTTVFSLPNVTGETVIIEYQPIRSSLVEEGKKNGGNALGLSAIPQVWWTIDTGWWESSDDPTSNSIGRMVVEAVEEQAKSTGLYLEYQFLNDASKDQEVMQHYGTANFAILQEVARRYDPGRVFQSLQPGGFKLND